MGIMIIELLASRIISKYFGNSLYTWTGIIGIVLGGITLGNYVGGKIADRRPAVKAAPVLLFIASGLTLFLLVLDLLLGFAMQDIVFESTFVMVGAAVAVIGVLFFLPATALGTISPVMAKYALEQSDKVGTTVGGIYASGAGGSILGTFLSGFVLVPLLGIRTVVFIVAAMIALLTLFIRTPKRRALGAWMAGLAVLFFFSVIGPDRGLLAFEESSFLIYETDSMYSHIKVEDYKEDNERVLVMDGLVHNMHDLSDPDHLLYEYERIYELATQKMVSSRFPGGEFTTLTLGGGAFTFPSYLERHYPEGEHHVVEIDPEVVRIAHDYFDLPGDTALKIHVQDARQFVRNTAGKMEFDIIYLDVFNSFSIPYHLTTREFTEMLHELLAPEGIVLVNLIDIFSIGKFIGAYTATVRDVFPRCWVYAEEDFDEDSRSTFVLAAAKENEGLGTLVYDHAEKFFALDEAKMNSPIERNRSSPLTDDHSPVENLMSPVFLDAIR